MTNPPNWTALVLGGGDAQDAFAAAQGVSVKPLIDIAGQPMGWYVLRALHDSGCVSSVSYIGPTTPDMDALITQRLTAADTLLGTLEKGLRALPACERVLICTADIPLLTGAELRILLAQVPSASLVYPIVSQAACEAAYPDVQRTYVTLRDGSFTGGNLFLADPEMVLRALPRLQEIVDARKNPLKLASLIGPDTLWRLLSKRLSVAHLEAKVSKLLGVSAHALPTDLASVGTDIDKDSDLVLARRLLGELPKS